MILTRTKRIINVDDISDELRDKINKLVENPNIDEVHINAKIKEKLEEINNKIKSIIDLKYIINNEKKYLKILQEAISVNGDFFIEGKMINIPAIKGDYTITFNYDTAIYISGVIISMTGWKKEDTWDLDVDKTIILNGLFIKEIGEEYLFRSLKLVNVNKDINIVFHNNSGNSRQILCDLEYIKQNN